MESSRRAETEKSLCRNRLVQGSIPPAPATQSCVRTKFVTCASQPAEIPAFPAIQVQPLSAIARLGRDIFFDTSLPSSGKVMDFYDFRDTNPEKVGADGKPQNPTAWMPRTALD